MSLSLGMLVADPLTAIDVRPLYPNTPQHPHVTLAWGVGQGKYQEFEKEIASVFLAEECWSDRIQAVRCQLQLGIPFELEIPHLTVSWIDGTKPVESTEMLRRKHQSTPMGVLIPCQIKWVALRDGAAVWRQKALAAIERTSSMYEAARSLGVARSTLRSRFENLPSEHPDKARYFKAKHR